MQLTKLKISGFRCFDTEGVTVDLDDLTCFVGPNASGKTAVQLALARLFGVSRGHRRVHPSDFHLEPEEKLNEEDCDSRELTIEARLDLPEMDESGDCPSIPEAFNQMVVDGPGRRPYCRVLLEATWHNDGTIDGDIEQSLNWVTVPDDEPDEQDKKTVRSEARRRIRVHYIPAKREPDQQLRASAESTFGQLLRALDLAASRKDIQEQLNLLHKTLSSLAGIETLDEHLQEVWSSLYDGHYFADVSFQAKGKEVQDLLKQLEPAFVPSNDGKKVDVSGLSDGYSC